MSITVNCVQCQKQYSVGEELIGRSARCQNCGATFVVGAPSGGQINDPLFDDLSSLADAGNMASPSSCGSNPPAQTQFGSASASSAGRRRSQTTTAGHRNLLIGVIAGSAAFALLICGGGIWFVVSAVKKEVRRAEIRKMMQDPQWRETHLGEKQGWQTYTDPSPLYGFSIEFPNHPKKQHQGFTAGGPQWIVMAHRDKETYSVVTLRPALGIDSEQAEQLRNAANVVAAGMKSRVTSQRNVAHGEFRGVEFDFESLPGEKSFSGRARLFATSKTFFQVGWMASPRAPISDEVSRFLDSFTLPDTAELPKPPIGLRLEPPATPTFNFQPRSLEELQADLETTTTRDAPR